MVGGAEITSFPLRWEELWLFTGVIVQEFDRRKRMGVFEEEEEEVEKKGEKKESFGKEEGVCVWITKGFPLKYPGN